MRVTHPEMMENAEKAEQMSLSAHLAQADAGDCEQHPAD